MLGRVAVIGCGLIGGSVLKSLHRNGRAGALFALDRAPVLSLVGPLANRAAEPGTDQARELVAAADLVVLAMPVFAIIHNLSWVLDSIRPDAVVTDTGSVKKPILAAAKAHLRGGRFVGGHPMAGRETGGFGAASADLFEGARWFVVPHGEGEALDRVAMLAEAVGATPASLEAQAHDCAMAYVSHAPQLLASALYAVAAEAGVIDTSGPGFRDVTRIAGGPSSMWRDIFESNRAEIASALAKILDPLVTLQKGLSQGGGRAVEDAIDLLERASRAKAAAPGARPKEGGVLP